jgi:hypothetical protein
VPGVVVWRFQARDVDPVVHEDKRIDHVVRILIVVNHDPEHAAARGLALLRPTTHRGSPDQRDTGPTVAIAPGRGLSTSTAASPGRRAAGRPRA